jgi:hypothetical protein
MRERKGEWEAHGEGYGRECGRGNGRKGGGDMVKEE